MKVTVLGYWGGFPSAGGATVGCMVSTEEGNILLDCGSGVVSRLQFYSNIDSISGVILSHLHYDHMADLGVLQYAVAGALRNGRISDKLKVYAPSKPEESFKSIHSVSSVTYELNDKESICLAGADISFIPVIHTIPCYAVRIKYKGKVLAYVTDTIYDESLIDFAKDADLLICEATICKGSTHSTGEGHMDASQAGTLAKKANVKDMVLIHLPHDGNLEFMRSEASAAYGKDVYLPNVKCTYIL